MYASSMLFAFDRQLLLADLIGDLAWQYDLQTGFLSFGDRFAWQAEVLGTESQESGTWLWAWANNASSIPAQQQGASLKLRALGEEHGIAELTEPMVLLDHADGHAFASIAVGEGLGKAIRNLKRSLKADDDIEVTPKEKQVETKSSAKKVADEEVAEAEVVER